MRSLSDSILPSNGCTGLRSSGISPCAFPNSLRNLLTHGERIPVFSALHCSLPVSFISCASMRVDNLGAYSIPSETGLIPSHPIPSHLITSTRVIAATRVINFPPLVFLEYAVIKLAKEPMRTSLCTAEVSNFEQSEFTKSGYYFGAF